MSVKKYFLAILEKRFRENTLAEGQEMRPANAPVLYKDIVFDGFLEVQLRKYQGYTGKNFDTGEELIVPERFSVRYKMDKKMADCLNSKNSFVSEISLKEDFEGVDKKELLDSLKVVRDELLKGNSSEIEGVVRLCVKTKESSSVKVVAEDKKLKNGDIDEEDTGFKFISLLNERLKD